MHQALPDFSQSRRLSAGCYLAGCKKPLVLASYLARQTFITQLTFYDKEIKMDNTQLVFQMYDYFGKGDMEGDQEGNLPSPT